MTWGDYIFGWKFRLFSPLPPDVVQRRINAASTSRFWPFSVGVAGWCRFGRLRLAVRSGPFEYNAKPLISGRIVDQLGATEIHVRFGAPAWAKVFYPFYYGLIFLFLAILVAAMLRGDGEQANAIFLVPFMIFCLLPIVLHYLGTRNSDLELAELLEFLEREIDAKPV